MRPAVLVISSIALLFFLGFLGYTFFARAHVTGLARDFVVARTVKHADSLVAALEELLREPAVHRQSGQFDTQFSVPHHEIG